MIGVLRLRRGERIVLAEFSADRAERVNVALNEISAETELEAVAVSRVPRGLSVPPTISWGLGVTLVAVSIVIGATHQAPSETPSTPSPSSVVGVQLPTLSVTP